MPMKRQSSNSSGNILNFFKPAQDKDVTIVEVHPTEDNGKDFIPTELPENKHNNSSQVHKSKGKGLSQSPSVHPEPSSIIEEISFDSYMTSLVASGSSREKENCLVTSNSVVESNLVEDGANDRSISSLSNTQKMKMKVKKAGSQKSESCDLLTWFSPKRSTTANDDDDDVVCVEELASVDCTNEVRKDEDVHDLEKIALDSNDKKEKETNKDTSPIKDNDLILSQTSCNEPASTTNSNKKMASIFDSSTWRKNRKLSAEVICLPEEDNCASVTEHVVAEVDKKGSDNSSSEVSLSKNKGIQRKLKSDKVVSVKPSEKDDHVETTEENELSGNYDIFTSPKQREKRKAKRIYISDDEDEDGHVIDEVTSAKAGKEKKGLSLSKNLRKRRSAKLVASASMDSSVDEVLSTKRKKTTLILDVSPLVRKKDDISQVDSVNAPDEDASVVEDTTEKEEVTPANNEQEEMDSGPSRRNLRKRSSVCYSESQIRIVGETPPPKKVASIFDPSTWSSKSEKRNKRVKPETSLSEDDSVVVVSMERPVIDEEKRNFLYSGIPESLQKHSQLQALSCPFKTGTLAPFPEVSHVTALEKNDMEWLEGIASSKYAGVQTMDSTDHDVPVLKHTCGLLLDKTPGTSQDTKVIYLEKCAEDGRERLLTEIKEDCSTFPVKRYFNALCVGKDSNSKGPGDEPPVGSNSHQKTGQDSGPSKRASKRLSSKKVAEKEEADAKESAETNASHEVSPLWSDKYAPIGTAGFLGNSKKVQKVKDWLNRWKVQMNRESKKLLRQMKREREKQKKAGLCPDDSLNDFRLSECSDESSDEDSCEFSLPAACLITGPHGVGKTALAFALAEELGYKVFEVNAACRRSGKEVLQQLQEAVESHQVGKENLSALFSTFHMTQSLPKTLPTPERKSKKRKTTADFFVPRAKKARVEDAQLPKKGAKSGDPSVSQSTSRTEAEGAGSKKTEGQGLNLTSCSLILFDEVDVMFEEDKGFWSAIGTLMQLRKRPIIMTSSDPNFLDKFPYGGGDVDKVHLAACSPVVVGTYLRLVCLSEGLETDLDSTTTLAGQCRCDLRQCLNTLQWWVDSGLEKPLLRTQTSMSNLESSIGAGQCGDIMRIPGRKRHKRKPVPDTSQDEKPKDGSTQQLQNSMSEIFTTEMDVTEKVKVVEVNVSDDVTESTDDVTLTSDELMTCEKLCGGSLNELSRFYDALSVMDSLGVEERHDRHRLKPSCSEESPLDDGVCAFDREDLIGLWMTKCRSWLDDMEVRVSGDVDGDWSNILDKLPVVDAVAGCDSSSLSRCQEDALRSLPTSMRLLPRRLVLDYLPSLRRIAAEEENKKKTAAKRRFFHYFDKISLNIKDSTLELLQRKFSYRK